MPGFRLHRIIRVRLQAMGLIHPDKWPFVQWLMRYYEIFVEEVSGRVVVNVIKEAKTEIWQGLLHTESIVDKSGDSA
jgi:hypothetical protein